MPIPKFDEFARPVLEILSDAGTPLKKSEINEQAASRANLTEEEKSTANAAGQATYKNRVGWALSWMKNVGWTVSPARGTWEITSAGRQRLVDSKQTIDAAEMRPWNRKSSRKTTKKSSSGEESREPKFDSLTAEDRLDAALAEIRERVQTELMERLAVGSPEFFEKAVLQVLSAMGYTGKLGTSTHMGKTADGGIDGILYQDRLGLERVHVQAKRWQASVGSPVVRDFAGAMDVEGATKGVIVTISSYSSNARKYVEASPKAIKLVDGPELVSLMVEFGVGVSLSQTVALPRLDLDFFEDD